MKKRVFLILSVVAMAVIMFNVALQAAEVTGTGKADGFGGPDAITVTITLEDGKIKDVKAEGPKETQGIGSVAIEKLPAEMVEKNSIKVDGMTGATFSSSISFFLFK